MSTNYSTILLKIKKATNSLCYRTVEFTLDEFDLLEKAVKLYMTVDDEVGRVSPLAVPEDNCSIELAIENSSLRDKIKNITIENEKLSFYKKALDSIGRVGCENLVHRKEDYHMMGDECPVEKKLGNLLKR